MFVASHTRYGGSESLVVNGLPGNQRHKKGEVAIKPDLGIGGKILGTFAMAF